MKKIFGLTAVLFFVLSNLYAQSDQKFHFGLKAAPSLAWLKTDSKGVSSEGTKLGFSYGLITEFNFGEHYAFATGVDVSYRGGKLKTTFTTTDASSNSVTTVITYAYNLEYIEIPLTLKFKTNEIGYLTYYLQAGVAPGINIRAKADKTKSEQITGFPIVNSAEDNVDVKDGINNINLSMILGGGVEYTLSGSTVLLAGITFSNGFVDVVDGDEIKANSNFLALTIGVLF